MDLLVPLVVGYEHFLHFSIEYLIPINTKSQKHTTLNCVLWSSRSIAGILQIIPAENPSKITGGLPRAITAEKQFRNAGEISALMLGEILARIPARIS